MNKLKMAILKKIREEHKYYLIGGFVCRGGWVLRPSFYTQVIFEDDDVMWFNDGVLIRDNYAIDELNKMI